MHLVQVFLPMQDNEGNAFAHKDYLHVRETLTKRFGGLTAYTRAPAEGRWKDGNKAVAVDDIVIFEVMAETLDEAWWRQYKDLLEKAFSQDEIVIRVQDIRLIG